ncbi:MAG: GNAT family N-acetyltransferase [Nitrospirota bacterium]|nr:GNAT family N-acetyltransferase [Nitrospirota bacterium]MDE3034368.1 GNAT family N-acetyltransferase [Nitrospirota bacterium]MDE3118442.1 GNAT family N-acetyltransferase [Nitrospirota bacterium]MDE3226611.1 GNAT family N-acetyltransferase [Nitrospirota bacterium]MDE3243674.1 GNAT family N-acetyltransferase [Nitrospirota bacterium]
MVTFSERQDIDPAQLVRLYLQAPWAAGRTEADVREMLAHTDLALSVWDGPRLVGFGRVLTDYVYRASIWDVIVAKDYQGQDIGTQIMQRILNHPSLKRVELFWLCTRDKQAFYEKLGFSAKEQTGMVWARSRQARQE